MGCTAGPTDFTAEISNVDIASLPRHPSLIPVQAIPCWRTQITPTQTTCRNKLRSDQRIISWYPLSSCRTTRDASVPSASRLFCPLSANEKVELAVELEGLGVDVIQTEGKFSLDPSK